ncbi:MAG: hypothetical protein JOZ78_14900 [Chroococcidiopsidaceae cyanobacterium CP_BM_ER_R8_30]|nr:hypothetical protein [Chroococcidiopsidaceae cyanobacterium CP_BM_ER_R8_30]
MKDQFPAFRPLLGAMTAFSTVLTLSLGASPTFAKDPFRATNQHQIGDKTEAAFEAFFRDGNYTLGQSDLKQAELSEPNEPLVYAMEASFAYTNKDMTSLNSSSQKTLASAQRLLATDPLRGNLYIAVGHFLEGAMILANQGTVSGAPGALSELQQVYNYLDRAEAVSATDPELNLIRGYMDLMISVNVPFSSSDQAMERLAKYAGPRYLADRGLALGQRDLGQLDAALASVNRALQAAPNNPELYYLKAQILAKQGQNQNNLTLFRESLKNFDIATQKKNQLPASLVAQIERERRRVAERLSAAPNNAG